MCSLWRMGCLVRCLTVFVLLIACCLFVSLCACAGLGARMCMYWCYRYFGSSWYVPLLLLLAPPLAVHHVRHLKLTYQPQIPKP